MKKFFTTSTLLIFGFVAGTFYGHAQAQTMLMNYKRTHICHKIENGEVCQVVDTKMGRFPLCSPSRKPAVEPQ